ncbi:hypothetical protein I79_007636 [Cricetulus griseus]|uniref:Secreted protein n=1 Tax=Cricetulus griseus TaxID=10029 RepID=G3HB22_CRIGR|nr:hypothetical protein I79_007636 [Cricetulus griseus]
MPRWVFFWWPLYCLWSISQASVTSRFLDFHTMKSRIVEFFPNPGTRNNSFACGPDRRWKAHINKLSEY